MVGLVLVSHGRLADELVATAVQIVGEIPRVATCSMDPATSPEEICSRIEAVVKSVDDGEGVLVFADLIGGTACTQSLRLCRNAGIEVLTGVNLPMLLKANSLRLSPQPLHELAHHLVAYAQRNITCATDIVRSSSR